MLKVTQDGRVSSALFGLLRAVLDAEAVSGCCINSLHLWIVNKMVNEASLRTPGALQRALCSAIADTIDQHYLYVVQVICYTFTYQWEHWVAGSQLHNGLTIPSQFIALQSPFTQMAPRINIPTLVFYEHKSIIKKRTLRMYAHLIFLLYFAPLLTDKLSFPSDYRGDLSSSPHVDVGPRSLVTGSLTQTLLGITVRQSRLGVSGCWRGCCCLLLLKLWTQSIATIATPEEIIVIV